MRDRGDLSNIAFLPARGGTDSNRAERFILAEYFEGRLVSNQDLAQRSLAVSPESTQNTEVGWEE